MRRPGLVLILALSGAACSRRAPAPIEIWIGGDVHVGDTAGRGLDPLSQSLAGAVGIVNLEGPVGEVPADAGALLLANAPSALAPLRAAGVHVAGIANNHAADCGAAGPEQTASALRGAGIAPAGGPAGAAVIDANGRRIAVTAHDLSAGVPGDLPAQLASARTRGDVLVATFHVTGPPSYLPRPELRAAVDVALAAGARVVAAHGTHALGPVERRGGAVIAWGLGNLLFACDCTNELDGAILRVTVDDQGVRARVLPIDAGLRGAPARPGHDVALVFDLLDAIGSSPLRREGAAASF